MDTERTTVLTKESDVSILENLNDSVIDENDFEFHFKKKIVYEFVKRVLDIIISGIAIVLLSPLFGIILLVVRFDDKEGNPIFVQNRCGKNGKEFKLYKFRTMCVDAEDKLESLQEQNEMDGPVFKIQEDPRITRSGKFLRATNLDELPQIINIFKGDMSFVGPRPALPNEVAQYTNVHKFRLKVKPGLTCYWQVQRNRNGVSFEEWMKLDRQYIEERNLWVDIKLFFRTILTIVCREGC